jgi:hypothetical protein
MASQEMVTKVDSEQASVSQPVQGQPTNTSTNLYVSKAVDDAEHADDEKDGVGGVKPIQLSALSKDLS